MLTSINSFLIKQQISDNDSKCSKWITIGRSLSYKVMHKRSRNSLMKAKRLFHVPIQFVCNTRVNCQFERRIESTIDTHHGKCECTSLQKIVWENKNFDQETQSFLQRPKPEPDWLASLWWWNNIDDNRPNTVDTWRGKYWNLEKMDTFYRKTHSSACLVRCSICCIKFLILWAFAWNFP